MSDPAHRPRNVTRLEYLCSLNGHGNGAFFPNPVLVQEASRCPAVIAGLLRPRAARKSKRSKLKKQNRGTREGLASPPLLPLPPPSSPLGYHRHHAPDFVSRRKVRTVSVALSSSNIALAEGALGCFYPHPFPISFEFHI